MLFLKTFITDPDSLKQKRTLKKTAVPSQNLPVGAVDVTSGIQSNEQPGPSHRAERLRQRWVNKETAASEECHCEEKEPLQIPQEEMEAAECLLQLLQSQPNYNGPKTFRDFEVQVNTPKVATLCDLLTTA